MERAESVLNNRGLGIKAKKCLYEGVIVPTAMYGAEAWVMRSAERRKVNVFEIKCLRRELACRADQRVLKWFRHVQRMDEYRMARRVLMAEVSGGRVRGRQRLAWMDGVKVSLGNRGMTVEAARQCAKDRKEWRALVHMYKLNEFHAAIFAWLALCSFGPPSRALVAITWRRRDAVT